MNIYVHEGCGHYYVGSVVRCVTETEEQAATMIREFLDANGLPNEALNIRQDRADVPGVFPGVDGDY